jgi:hypothetical protein
LADVEPSNGQTMNVPVRFGTDQGFTWRDASGRQWYVDGSPGGEARPWKPGKRSERGR